jgi:hypothetical protein
MPQIFIHFLKLFIPATLDFALVFAQNDVKRNDRVLEISFSIKKFTQKKSVLVYIARHWKIRFFIKFEPNEISFSLDLNC